MFTQVLAYSSVDLEQRLEQAGRYAVVVGGISLVLGLLSCFLGYKLTKVYIAICGFLLGAAIGGTIGAAMSSATMVVVLGLIVGICAGFVAYKAYKVGIFIMAFLTAGLFVAGVVIGYMSRKNGLSIQDYVTTESLLPAIIAGVVAGIIAGVICVIITKPMLIVTTSLSGGMYSGALIAAIMKQSKLSLIFGLVLFVAGLIVQIKTNNGILEHEEEKPMSQNYRPQQYVNPYAAGPEFMQYSGNNNQQFSQNGNQYQQNGQQYQQGGDFFQSRPRQ